MIKVCHMTNVHGAEDIRIFHKECVSLAKAGYEVYLVERGDTYDKQGVHIVGVGDIPSNRIARMTWGARKVYLKALEIDADAYHLHDPELLPYGLKLKRKGKKVIFDSHEKYTLQLEGKPYLPLWCTRIIARLYGFYEAYVLKRIDGIIFPCPQNGKHPFEGMCRHIATVNNVPLMREIEAMRNGDCEKISRSVGYVGVLGKDRAIDQMIKAAYEADATFFLAGKCHSLKYQREIESMPEYQCVVYKGILNREQVCDLLPRCEIGLATLPNIGQYNQYDNLATKVYEYMAAGIPTIISDAPYHRQVMRKFPFGICVNPEDTDEVSSAIRYLLDHPDEARQMGENGRRAVTEEFNWGVEEKKLLALYRDVIGTPI